MKQKLLSYLKFSAILLLFLSVSVLSIYLLKLHLSAGGWDWTHFFLPATQALLSGRNPYEIAGFYNPPWVFIATIPFALLPANVSGLAVGLMNFVVVAILTYRLKAHPILAIITIFSPAVIWGFLLSNIDWLVLIGLFLPPQIGLFFVLLKPQVGLGIAFFWAFESWKKGKLLEVIRVFSPVVAAYALSFLVYNFYLIKNDHLSSRDWNTSFFPYSIILGLFLLIYSLKKREANTAAASSPFFSPYVGLSSWSVTLLGLMQYPWLFFISNGALWAYFIINKIFYNA